MKEGRWNNALLPMHILELIFLKLPVESLVRLKRVCKDWRTVIRSPSFVHCYNKELLRTTENQFVVLVSRFDIYSISISTIDCGYVYVGVDKICQNGYGFGLVGSCNGVLCFTNKKHKLSLYNPSERRELLVLHLLDMKILDGIVEHKVFGFGYDCNSNDYKVVRILWFHNEHDSGIVGQVDVFSLRSKSWKNVEGIPYKPNIKTTSHGVYVENAVHWLVAGNFPSCSMQILSFDLGLEKFSLVAQPIREADKDDDHMTLHVLNGCLALCIRPSANSGTDIWVMKSYGVKESWMKLFTIDAYFKGYVKPIALSKDESEVLLTSVSYESRIPYSSLICCGKFWWYDVNGMLFETQTSIPHSNDGLKIEVFLGSKILMNK